VDHEAFLERLLDILFEFIDDISSVVMSVTTYRICI
jgi:hypothetical protein